MPLWVPTKINCEYKKALQRLDKVIYGIIEKRKNDTVKNIIHETLRLYPPLYILSRDVTEEVVIGGYRFKKGDMILISSYVMQHDPEYFDQPESFIPERFENNFMKSLPAFAYFPFGGGPRVCIGNHFALMEAVFVLACIANRYRIRLAPDHNEAPPFHPLHSDPRVDCAW
ncbi:cytochrome P450 [Peribacillus simplex]|uniref:cytochrome P450 n=1 Tax=Peribacillus simplex TaxID=1478 RepID=UPI001F4FE0F8|nr:cytochrome P450 [Peribacillus simplex]